MLLYSARSYNEAFWGDSLTANVGASSAAAGYPYVVANSGPRGRSFYMGGVGGNTSTQIAVRQGAVATTATISGGQIPASGGVTVTFPGGYEPATAQGPFIGAQGVIGIYGTISGVYGQVTYSGGVYTFTRSFAGSVVNVSSAQFVPDVSFSAGATQLIWAGRNNFSNSVQVQSDIAAMAANTSGRYLVLSIITSSTDSAGDIASINALNTALSSTYGARYSDVLSVLVAQGAPTGGYPDPTAYAAGYPPSGLVNGPPHLNDAGYAFVAATVYAKIAANNW